MIVSHRHRFIFIKTRKTAGTSVEIALAKICGPEDIVTPIAPEDELLRPGHGPRNHVLPFRKRSLKGKARSLVGMAEQRHVGFFHHMPAERVRRLVGREVWDAYLKFTVVRNPFDQMVSRYHWDNKNKPAPESFGSYVRRIVARGPLNVAIYSVGGRPAMDRYLRYENLQADFSALLAELGMAGAEELPRAKSGHRPARSWRDYFDDETRALVEAASRFEVETFGYTF